MPHEPSSVLHTAEIVHWVALCVMVVVYSLRLRWLLRFKASKDRSAPGNPRLSNAKKGGYYSLANIAMPWAMESTRKAKGLRFYFSFVLFHLGIAAGIALAFVSTISPATVAVPAVSWTIGSLIAGALLVALYRVLRRTMRPVLRLISTPDDYFSLAMLTVWLGLGVMTQGHLAGSPWARSELLLVAYLYLTSFFLLYVPFSKISHYLYYPFTRWWIGKALGHRGTMPAVRG